MVIPDPGESVQSLVSYQYLFFLVDTDFWGHIPDEIPLLLSRNSALKGKKCYAYTIKRFIGAKYALTDLMKLLESNGMKVRNFGVLGSERSAERTGISAIIT